MALAYSPYELPLIASGLACLALVALMWPRRSAMGAGSFILLPLAVALWAFANALEIACIELPAKLFWANVEYLSIVSLPVIWLAFAREYSRGGDRLPRRTLALLAVIPAITLALVWTDNTFGLVRHDFAIDPSAPYSRISKVYGPWFYVHVVYSYILLSAGVVYIARALVRSPHIYRGQAFALLVACAVPWAGNAFYVLLGRSPFPPMDPTPINFTISCLAFAEGLRRWRLLDLVPAARDAVIEGMSDALIVLDTQHRIVDLNPAACRVIGCTPRQAVGQPVAKALFDRPDLAARYRDVLEAQEEITLGEGDRRRHYDLHISPMRDRAGRLAGRLVTLHDITRRKQLEVQLREAQKLEAVGRLAGGVSHHFNNLLTVIIAHGEFVRQGLDPASTLRPDVERILAASRQAGELTRQLLAFGRRQHAMAQAVSLNDLLTEMRAVLRHLLGEDITLELKLAPDLGDVRADPAQVEQAIVNLLSNARDAMPAGGVLAIETAEVDLAEGASTGYLQAHAGRYVRLTIRDTGVGMGPEVREHLFEPFFTTKPVGKGTGLGLPAVYGIVEECGGCIDVTSEPGRGTTFTIYLPRLERAAREVGSPDLPPTVRGSETILVVEDEDAVRAPLVQALKALGYAVLEARDGEEALRLCRESTGAVDLVLTDVVMPRLNGRELAAQLGREHRGLRVAYMSGHPEDTVDALGALDEDAPLIRKPFTTNAIARAVRRALDAPPAP